MQLYYVYFLVVGFCLSYCDGGGHEKHVKVSIPKLVHKHKHEVVVHEKHDDKKHIVIHKHEHKHHHKHDHGHKHGHKHEAKHHHKHSAKHHHKHEGKHQHKHEAKHQHKHQAKHQHKHEGKHQHKHEGKHSHKHKHSHKEHGKHEHHHKHHGKHEHKHKHKHTEKHGKHHEKLVLDIDDQTHAGYEQEPLGPSQEYVYAPYQIEGGDYEDFQQQNEETSIDDDHDNLENYDDFDSPSENIENYDDDVDFLNAKKAVPAYEPYNYNGAIIGEVVKGYGGQEPALAIASNNVIKKVTPNPFSFDDDDLFQSFNSPQKKKPMNKKYQSIRSGKLGVKEASDQSPWVPIQNSDATGSASSTIEKKISAELINRMDVISNGNNPSSTTLKSINKETPIIVSTTTKNPRLSDHQQVINPTNFQSSRLSPKTTIRPRGA